MPIPPEANVRLKVEADITKRSKPVHSAKAALTRFGSVLPGHCRAPPNSTHGSSTSRLFPPRHGALVRDLRPLRIRIVNVRGTGYKLIVE